MCELLKNRVSAFLNEFGMPATVFCNRVIVFYLSELEARQT